jgi:hypothetical protein
MKVVFHPEFPKDIRKFEGEYVQISEGLSQRFRQEVDSAVEAIKSSPTSAGHLLSLGSVIVPDLRRRNLKAFPFFVLYGVVDDQLIFGSVIPSKSDPLTWLTRFAIEKR